MRREDIINYLLSYLSSFLYHTRFFSEMINLIAGSGYEQAFFKIFVARLRALSIMGKDAIQLKEFELLKSCGIYSMHISSKGFNYRILYSFLPNGQPVLLLPFFERAGKKKTDYTPYIGPALSRFAEVKEEYENGL